MTTIGRLQIVVFFALTVLLTRPLGRYLFDLFESGKARPGERLLFKLCGVDPAREQTWLEYTIAMLLFSAVGLLVLYALQRLQAHLPFNPQHFAAIAPDLAFNTAASFTTNTNWQAYSGESAMSYFTQMAGLAWHNFTSAAVGIAIALAVARRASSRRSRWIRWPRRKPSRCSAPMAAASSMPIARILSRTPPRSPTSSRCWPSSRYRRRFAVVTTDASCGAVNAMHDSFTPLGGLVPLVNIQLGELVFGGVGSGLYAILIYAILTVFIAGLMVGRTPEYLGKKIEAREMKLAMFYVLPSMTFNR